MTIRESFLNILRFGKTEEFPFTEFLGFWSETVSRWKKEGIPESEDVFKHFGLFEMKYIPIDFSFVPKFERKVIEEADNYIIYTDECNCTKKEFKNSSAMPNYMDFPIKTRRDFYEIKERMNAYSYQRYPGDWDTLLKEYENRNFPLWLLIRGPFAFCRDFIKFNDLMLMFYDDVDFIKEMMEFQVDFTMELWEKVLGNVNVDLIYIGEDMAYKNGPMISPALVSELIIPQYKKLIDYFKQFKIENIFLDSDGDIEKIIPMILESGFTGILPVENSAGMDPIKLRDEFPKLKMIGGINKLNIAESKEGIEYEIQKDRELCSKGGYIPSFDHSVPPIVCLENYKYYIEKLKEEVG